MKNLELSFYPPQIIGFFLFLVIINLLIFYLNTYNQVMIDRYIAVPFKGPDKIQFIGKDKTQEEIQKMHVAFMLTRKSQSKELKCQSCDSSKGMNNAKNPELNKLSEKVQQTIHKSQNPENCMTARFVVLPTTTAGYGSQVHRLLVALALALHTNRTLVFNDTNFRYKEGGWSYFHKPLSRCSTRYITSNTRWDSSLTGQGDTVPVDNRILWLKHTPLWQKIGDIHREDVPAIPREIAQELVRLHHRPNLWWNGQLVAYITRLNSTLETRFKQTLNNMPHSRFNVGIHIRRTDKYRETAYQPIEKYIEHAADYLKTVKSNGSAYIYVASDDPEIPAEVSKRYLLERNIVDKICNWGDVEKKDVYGGYPHYQFANTPVRTRNSEEGLSALLSDLYLLLHSDFIVCTMSSNICRYVYGMQQYLNGDCTKCLRSLDAVYCMGLQYRQHRYVIKDYTLMIPLRHNHTDQHSNDFLLNDEHIIERIGREVLDCHPDLPIDKYAYSVLNSTILVRLAKRGDIISPFVYNRHNLPNYELGINRMTGFLICYPAATVVDYVKIW